MKAQGIEASVIAKATGLSLAKVKRLNRARVKASGLKVGC